MLFLLFLIDGYSQSEVRGRVFDGSNNKSLPGVNIIVKELPTLGTTTDIDGNFKLNVPESGKTLVFSFIGYANQEIEIGGKSYIEVTLSLDAELIDEVVITAIGIEKEKKTVGYSVQNLGGSDIENARESNLVNALTSKVSGVEVTSTSGNPGASANIVIRGRSSLNNNSPLFVVDGVPIDNSYAGSNFIDHSNRAIDINPSDIENLTVLKGPAATALYGVRAANGAIIITTKKGKAGRTSVTFNQSVTFDRVNKLPIQQGRYAQGEIIGGIATYLEPLQTNRNWGPDISTLSYDGDENYQFSSLGRIVDTNDPSANGNSIIPFNNSEEFFNTGFTSNSYLSLSGGNDQTQYFASAGFLTQTGIVPNSDFERLSIKLSGQTQMGEKLTISSSANYINSGGQRMQRGSNLSGVMLGLMRTPITFDLSNGLDDPEDNPDSYSFEDGSQRTYWAAYDNPYWSVNKNRSTDIVDRVIGNLTLNYKFSSWLSAMYRIGIDNYFEERQSYWDNNSNEFGTGVIFNDLYSFRGVNSDFLITADQALNEKLNLKISLGHNYLAERSYTSITEGETFVIPNFYDISNVSQVTFVDDFVRKRRIAGAFYDTELSYENYLFLNITGRLDWPSTLPAAEVPFFYDSYNLGFVFTEPLEWSTNTNFSYGKLRLSYATVGGDAFPYALNTFYSAQETVQGQTSFLQQTTIGNAQLKPEKTQSIELGLDLRFFGNRLGIDATVYRSNSKDQIIEVPVANSSGFSLAIDNAGEIQNEGIEILLFGTPVKGNDLTWDININFASNENTVVELAEGVNDIRFPGSGVTSTSNRAIPGEPYGVIYGTQWLRDESGNILIDENGYPLFDPQNPGVVGDPNPEWTMGLRNSFSYKQFYLSALLDFRQGGDIYSGTVGVMKNLGIHEFTENREEEIVWEGVYQSNGETNTTPIQLDQSFYTRYPFAGVSEEAIYDGSWIRLREVTLSYSFEKEKLKKLPIESLSFGLNARNVFLITDFPSIDPETNLSGASNSFGRDYFNSPNTRSLGFNISVKF